MNPDSRNWAEEARWNPGIKKDVQLLNFKSQANHGSRKVQRFHQSPPIHTNSEALTHRLRYRSIAFAVRLDGNCGIRDAEKRLVMIDFRAHGKRCSAKRLIRSHAGTIEQSTKGTIAFQTENLGRQLVLVDWDRGPSTYAFTNEIEIIDTNARTERRS